MASLITSNHAKGDKPVSTTITVSGTNKVLVAAGIATGNAGDPGTLTLTAGGSSPTGILYASLLATYYRPFFAYWVAPADGSCSVGVNHVNAGKDYIWAALFDGIDQSTPIGTYKDGTAMALTGITCDVDDLLVDFIAGTSDSVTGTPDANWTLIQKDYIYNAYSYGNGGGSYKFATSTSESSTWTGTIGVIKHGCIPLKIVKGGQVIFWS